MKKALLVCLVIGFIPLLGLSQAIENLDYIAPFSEDLAAIKKGNQWAFINKEGVIAIDYRNDLVTTKSDDENYPIFKDERCLIEKEKDGIFYYGYINTSGNTVIEPKFLNATNFKNNIAIALELKKEEAGKNEVLNKTVIYYKYFEVLIDTDANIKDYLTPKGINVALDKKFLEKRPKITSKRISEKLISLKSKDGKWTIKKIN